MFLYIWVLLYLSIISSNSLSDARQHNENQRHMVLEESTPTNRIMLQGFEWYVLKDSQHWNRLNTQLGKLAAIGIDRIWMPPASKANAYNSTGYDVYDLWDLGEFDAKGHVATSYGTKEELLALSTNAARHGISLVADAVLNQRSGADAIAPCLAHMVNAENRLEVVSDSQMISAWANFNFSVRNGKYSNKTWSCEDFTAVDYDDASGQSAIWKIEADNNDFAADVSAENGNYDYLMLADVAYNNPSVQEDVKAWGRWIVEELDLSGFRLDAAKHISESFLQSWVSYVKEETGREDLLFVAEYLTWDPAVVSDFTGYLNAVSVFDTPLQIRFHDFSVGALTNLSAVLDSSWLSVSPDQAVTYVMNHDTQSGQAMDHLEVQGWFIPLAYALILLRVDGYPCLFYGDLYGVYNDHGWFTTSPYATVIADLALARKHFAYGEQTDYFDSTSVIGWTRQGDYEHPDGMAVIMSNEQGVEDQYKTMNVGAQHAGEVWSSIFGGEGQVTIGIDGYADFVAGPGTVNVFTREDARQGHVFGSWSTVL